MKNGNFLQMHVSEIRVKRIRVNQGLGVHRRGENEEGIELSFFEVSNSLCFV